jgi:F0F1-type ATP synthase delta subunit
MFFAGSWAAAFVDASGSSAKEGLELLKILIPAMGKVSGIVTGTAASHEAVRILRGALVKAGLGPEDRGAEFALRTLGLLIKKGRLKYGTLLIGEIEKVLERREGILPVTVETAFPLDSEFQQTLEGLLKKQTGARGVRLKIALVPELLGGCRLRIGDRSLDVSLRGRLQKMAADLQAAGGFSW